MSFDSSDAITFGSEHKPRSRRCLSRRELLAAITAYGLSGWLPNRNALAQIGAENQRRLDLHHHFFPQVPLKRFIPIQLAPQPMLDYTPQKAIEAMDRASIEAAFLSCPIRLGDNPARVPQGAISVVRGVNEYGAKLRSDHKGRFGLFAMLPLPEIDASLREIEYALETLKADGVGLLTSYGNRWLGDKAFQPVFDELNRRNSVVYSHPVDGPCCRKLVPDTGPQTVEYNTDTSRAIWSMINDVSAGLPTTSMATRYSNIRFVWSHAGGSLLGLVGRFLGTAASAESLARTPERNSRLYHLRRFYYDIAGSANPIEMNALKALVGTSQIVFGSDFPFVPIVDVVQRLEGCGFGLEELRQINRDNALRFLTRFA